MRITGGCLTATQILNANGRVINNPNGTISVFVISPITGMLAPMHLTKPCCERLGIDGAYFDVNSQECRWSSDGSSCDYAAPFNLVLNPRGNDGTIFSVNPEETCTLGVDFDYLFKFDCAALAKLIKTPSSGDCRTTIDVFESISASMTIDVVDIVLGATVLTKVYEEQVFQQIGGGNLYTYLKSKSADTGFYVCGTTGATLTTATATTTPTCYPIDLYDMGTVTGSRTSCTIFENQVLGLLFQESGLPTSGMTEFKQNVNKDAFASNWLHFDTVINDPIIISAITNEKIKLTVKLSGSCIDGCLLLDNIALNKNCTKVVRNDIFLSKSPSFELDRIRDNKKSWITNTETTHREFNVSKPDGTQPIRFTDYYLDDERQIINTKELDLDINIASAIETDVWCYISNNPCVLTGLTGCIVYTSSTTASTVISTGMTSGYTCSQAGYLPQPANDCCKAITSEPALGFATGQTIVAGSKNGTYGQDGAYFYRGISNLDPSALPVYFSLTGGSNLYNQTGGTITASAINNSIFNSFWTSQGISSNGRLNNVDISGSTTGTSSTSYHGISYTFSAATGGTYYIGFAGKTNGITININNNDLGAVYSSTSSVTTAIYSQWHVLEVEICSGLNIIEARFYGDKSDFGLEVYQPIDFATLTGATDSGSTQANVIYSTVNEIGATYSLGSDGGYTCTPGFLVNTYTGFPYPCSEIKVSPSAPVFSGGVMTASTATTITTSTGYTTSTTQCCNPLYISAATILITGTTPTCPAGYSATSANTNCQQILTTAATFNGSGTTIVHGTIDINYCKFGALFYPTIQNNGALPVYYNTSFILKDQTGGTITALAANNTNPFWTTSGVTTGGRLNASGISASTTEYLGFSQCINLSSGGTYYIGIAADNHCKFKLNGTLIANLTGFTTASFNLWSVFPVQLTAGINIIEMEGINDSGQTAFGVEIYNPIDFATLTGATNTGSTQANVIFSSVDRIGTLFDLGTTVGYSCPSGYALDKCSASPTCVSISNTGITNTTTNVSITATTGCCSGSCGDTSINVNELLTQPLSAVTTIEDFEYFITSELIDAKDRKTSSAYPTLRLLYDRYMNSTIFCDTNSSKFDYATMNKFAGLIGNYWVDIIEQVIPATTLWGSTRIYTNTIFDIQKYKYRGYSTFFGVNTFTNLNVLSPASGTSISANVTTTVIQGSTSGTTLFNQGDENNYTNLYLIQMNNGSEFLGSVNIVGQSGGDNVINETF